MIVPFKNTIKYSRSLEEAQTAIPRIAPHVLTAWRYKTFINQAYSAKLTDKCILLIIYEVPRIEYLSFWLYHDHHFTSLTTKEHRFGSMPCISLIIN